MLVSSEPVRRPSHPRRVLGRVSFSWNVCWPIFAKDEAEDAVVFGGRGAHESLPYLRPGTPKMGKTLFFSLPDRPVYS